MSRAGTPVVVTGVGVVAPNGLGLSEYWSSVLARRSGITALTRFGLDAPEHRLAGQIDGFEARDHLVKRLLPQTDPSTRLALVAADRALAESRVQPEDALAAGVATANTCGGFDFGQRELQNLCAGGPRHVSAYMSFAWFYAVNSGQVAIRHDLRGPISVVVADQAGGLDALAEARRRVRAGTQIVVGGAVDSSLCPYGMAAHVSTSRLAGGTDPAATFLPFDARARGYVPGEGGALMTVQAQDTVAADARVYGELAGWAATFDPPPADGRPPALRAAIDGALDDAGVDPGDVAVVFADAAGDRAGDVAEAEAISAVFGPRGVPVTAPKTLTGRIGSGAGPLDTVTAMVALSEGVVPPTPHVVPDPELELDLVTEPRPTSGRNALVLARGAGGFNSALLVAA